MKESRQKSDPGGLPGSKHVAAGTMPSLHSVAEQETTNKRPTASSAREQGTVTDIMTDKINMPLWLQVIASMSIPVILALLALVSLINPQFAELRTLIIENRDDIAALDHKLSGEIAALDSKQSGNLLALDTKLSGEIAALDTKLSGEIAALDTKLSGQISALDSRLTGEIAALDTKLSGEIAALDTKLSGQISALDSRLTGEIARLDNRITVEVTRLDNKFDALANLMIVAHTNGGATEAELVAIWESVRNPE